MKLLLHICCAPCLIWPHEVLKNNFNLTGFFYNPNIEPQDEYKNRICAVQNYTQEINLETVYPESNTDTEDFLKNIENNLDKPKRCQLCWQMRLKKTASFAKENNFDYFSSTLLVSPYQNHELLKKIAQEVAREYNIEFYYQDFRPGFRNAYNKAKLKGIYRQKYCGCIYSRNERKLNICNHSEKY